MIPDVTEDVDPAAYDRDSLFAQTVLRLLAPVRRYLEAPASDRVSEIMINGPDTIYVEARGRLTKVDERFEDTEALASAARAIAQYSGKLMTRDALSIEARLPDGSRVHILQAPAARNGLSIAIRKFGKVEMRAADLVTSGAIAPDVAAFLRVCMQLRKNIVISGGTSTGKTTFLNALSEYMDDDERIIVIEDVNELAVPLTHVLYFEAQKPDRFGRGGIDIRELFRASLRMRPDRILVGECRGGEALDMIQAMTSGHSGSVTTLHANTARDALHRLETMALMSDVGLPQLPLRQQIAQAVDIVVQLERLPATRQRGVVQVAEVRGLTDQGMFEVADVFEKSDAVHTRRDSADNSPLTNMTGHKVRFAREGASIARAKGIACPDGMWG